MENEDKPSASLAKQSSQLAPQKPHYQTNWLKILSSILLGSIAIVGAVFIGIQIGKNQAGSSEPIVQQPSTPLPTTSNLTFDSSEEWLTYSNEKYGFTTEYYPESPPNELEGDKEVGQFTYLFLINFGTNPVKSPFGYKLRISQKTPDYRGEIVGHIADKIDSEEKTIVNNIEWTILNYQIFLTTDYVQISMAITDHGDYSYAITSSTADINKIISTFQFTK